jgi:FAD/FMN-containing dehydrogenase
MVKVEGLGALRAVVGAEHVIDSGETLETLSKDFYWYSPVLKRQIADRKADAIIRPGTREEAARVMAEAFKAGVPVVARGAGTGNYGQCVPLYGGWVIDLSRLDRIHSVDGVVRCEPGARMGTIETLARAAGWELRCMPSTWMKCTLGGFLSGGSGGIGSITWGGINAPGNVKSLTLMTCEAEPRLLRLEEEDCLRALHTYGTTGIVVEIEMRLAPKIDYEQLALTSPDWEALLAWTDAAARNSGWRKRLVTQFEAPIPGFFKPLRRHLPENRHASFLLIERARAAEAAESALAAGLAVSFRQPLPDPPRPPFLTDYTWNHTTLWAMQAEPDITYLQAGFAPNFREQFAALQGRFPGEILLHLEWTVGNAKMLRGGAELINPDPVVVGGIPLVRFRGEERLNEILAACAELNIFIANPHTYLLEGGGRHPNIEAKRLLKAEVDPAGLLNPGKMATYAFNPFAAA